MMSTAIALVHAYVLEHPELWGVWVNDYTSLRWSGRAHRLVQHRVNGHWRRKALWGKLVPALNCTCKFEPLANPSRLITPPVARRARRDEDGVLLDRRYRVLVWV